jgi:CHASE3 domain sensor protein
MVLHEDILQQMLAAAAGASKEAWSGLAAKFPGIAQAVLDDAKQTAEDAASGAITPGEAKVQLAGIRDEIDMAAYFADEALKIAAQNALNAALDVLWSAVQAAIPKP